MPLRKLKRLFFCFFLLSVLWSCCATREFSVDKYLPGTWKIDSITVNRHIEEKILPKYLENMKQIYSESQMYFGNDNTFRFILAGNKQEGIWFTSYDEKTLVTRAFGEAVTDSFQIEAVDKNTLILKSYDIKNQLIIYLNREK